MLFNMFQAHTLYADHRVDSAQTLRLKTTELTDLQSLHKAVSVTVLISAPPPRMVRDLKGTREVTELKID